MGPVRDWGRIDEEGFTTEGRENTETENPIVQRGIIQWNVKKGEEPTCKNGTWGTRRFVRQFPFGWLESSSGRRVGRESR
jgi:hypothetical protein